MEKLAYFVAIRWESVEDTPVEIQSLSILKQIVTSLMKASGYFTTPLVSNSMVDA